MLGLKTRGLQLRINAHMPEFKHVGAGYRQNGGVLKSPEPSRPKFPRFTDDDIPVDEIRAHLRKRVEMKMARDKEEEWFPILMPDDRPFGICIFGDPHLGEHANWPLLEDHIAACVKTEGLYGVNIGDTIDNWPLSGRLAKLWAERDVSQSTEWKLVRWFFHDSGIDWLVWLLGNHDTFNTNSAAMFKEISRNIVPVMDTEAKFVMRTPNGSAFPVHARHEFKGHSQYNNLHALDRFMNERSDVARGIHVLGVEGHKHNWAIHEKENPDRGYFFTTARARGYKISDGYAKRLGFNEQEYGASLVYICNPQATKLSQRTTMWKDVEEGAQYLKWLRKRFK